MDHTDVHLKICGITSLDDAFCTVEAGADLLGFIFYARSPRYIAHERAAEIISAVHHLSPAITTVGVFVDETPDRILAILSTVNLDLAQLSGNEPPEYLPQLAGRAYKAIRKSTAYASFIVRQPSVPPCVSSAKNCPDLLLDADHPSLYGGSGLRANETFARSVAQECRLMLAGGLNPDNVEEVVRKIQPWGVDVSSGVEDSPGKKDHTKIHAFIEAVRRASQA